MNYDKYLHQRNSQIIEIITHEAVHSLKNTFSLFSVSIEEECDAFTAGIEATVISEGHEPAEILSIDGLPVAEFVKKSYKWARHEYDYKPIGESLVWLKKRTGL